MAEYIDREKLLNELGESASYHAESGREYQLLLRDRNIVREQPTSAVIERFKVNKAIDEMKKLSQAGDYGYGVRDCIERLNYYVGGED